jgi:hypothetical protein
LAPIHPLLVAFSGLSEDDPHMFFLALAGAGAIGTLKTGYPRIQALCKDKEQGVHPRADT